MSYFLWPFELQHSRLPCPSLYPRVCSKSCPLSLWCHLTISSSVFPFFPQSFSTLGLYNELVLCIRWPKYWSFGFSISPSNEYSGLSSFRIDWFNVCPVQGTLKRLLQHQNLKASILWLSAFFMVQHSYPYMTIGKTIALTMHTFVRKMMSLLFNTLSRFLITFIPSSKCLLISWLPSQFWSLNKICHCFHFFPSYLSRSDGTRCHDLSFFECYVLSQLSHSFLLPSSRGSSVPFCFQPRYHLHIWGSAGG